VEHACILFLLIDREDLLKKPALRFHINQSADLELKSVCLHETTALHLVNREVRAVVCAGAFAWNFTSGWESSVSQLRGTNLALLEGMQISIHQMLF